MIAHLDAMDFTQVQVADRGTPPRRTNMHLSMSTAVWLVHDCSVVVVSE